MNTRQLRNKTGEKSAVRSKENIVNENLNNENDKLAPSNKIKKLNRRHSIKLVERSGNANSAESTVGRQLKTIDGNRMNNANKKEIKLDEKYNGKLVNRAENLNQFVDVFRNQDDLNENARLVKEIKEREERLIALKLRSIGRWKFKIDCPHVDFVYELGFRKYIQLAITKVFRYLDDKDLSAAFCVSNMWNRVLSQNGYTKTRLISYLKEQKKLKSRIGLENYPAVKKKEITSKRRVLGEMTNQKVMNR